ncbi:MAG: Mrp/NBP35 family ATP-binding protein, partial [Actinobacteria bacterium]|nr:Mrp/NBP35 family ATP-binding protein [Actinomycetota bacterium]
MATTDEITSALRGVLDPELGVDVVELGMVRGVALDGAAATIDLALTIASCPLRSQIEDDVVRKVTALPGVDSAEVRVTAMTERQRAELMGVARRTARDNAAPTMVHPTTRVIAVGSGKGGVGKSSLSVNLAAAIADAGFRVGVLDADIWGFSVPRMLGVTGQRLEAGDDRKIRPLDAGGIQLVSTGLMLDDEETALMWRGLMLSKALEQFLHDVAWDEALDYLVIDMPPGTGDIQMALARLLPQAEMVVVTTPQKAAQKVATRVADMARRSYLPVVGVIENMSGFTADDGTHYDLFGRGGGQVLADGLGVPLIGQIPLDPVVVEGGDEGAPVVRSHPDSPSARAVTAAAVRLVELVPPAADETCTARIAVL